MKGNFNMDYLKNLKANPIFAMSLSEKELFHSNFWAWLFERNKKYIGIFFDEIIDIKEYTVEREQGNRDITVWTENGHKAYVIENKLKSIPKVEQLIKYQQTLDTKFTKGIITGIYAPRFELDGWKFMSYDVIGRKIKEIANKTENDCFEKQLIIRYADMLADLISAMNESYRLTLNKWQLNCFKNFEKSRIDDVLKKLKASELASYLDKELKDAVPENAGRNGCYTLRIEEGFTNKSPLIDLFYVFYDSNELSKIGIQIQGTQYKRIVEYKKMPEEKKDKIFEKFAALGWFEDYDRNNSKIIMGRKTAQTKRYCLFKPAFMYQYWTMDEEVPFEVIKEHLIDDLSFAAKILAQISV